MKIKILKCSWKQRKQMLSVNAVYNTKWSVNGDDQKC